MMHWTYNPDSATLRAESVTGAPVAKYVIVDDGADGAVLWVDSPHPLKLMRGTVEECQALAEASEAGPAVFEYEPEVGDLAALPDEVAAIVALARRVGVSGERLKRIVEESLPAEIRDLEIGILKRATKSMWRGITQGQT